MTTGKSAVLAFVTAVALSALPGASQTLFAQNASRPVTLTLRLAGDRHEFHAGEIIPVELVFDSAEPRRFAVDGSTYGRIGPRENDVFSVEPIGPVADPMLDYLSSRGVFGGSFIGTTGVLGDAPFVVHLQLNDWFRFDSPGAFTLSMHSTRATDESLQAAGAAVPLDSNTVSFAVLARDAQWERNALAGALAAIDSPGSDLGTRGDACRALAALGTDGAADAIVTRYTVDGNSVCYMAYTIGLFAAPNRARVVRQMEAGLRDPNLPITSSYVRTLALLSLYEQHPERRPAQSPESKGRTPGSGQTFTEAEIVAAMATYEQDLTEALSKKNTGARAATLAGQPQIFSAATTAAADLASGFLELPPDRQRSLLDAEWPRVASPAMLPALRVLVAAPPSPGLSLADVALRRLYELAPAEARPILLRQIADPPLGASLATLGVLPDAELPTFDETLVAGLDVTTAGADSGIRADLIARYASSAVEPRVRAWLDARLGRMPCRPQAALLEYFLRVDPGAGGNLLNRALDARQRTGCYGVVLTDVSAVLTTHEVIAAAAAHIGDENVGVAVSAIHTLAKEASVASLALLRDRFVRWHNQWQGRAAELRYNPAAPRPGVSEAMIESSLVRALGQDRRGAMSRAEADDLGRSCVTDSCRVTVRALIDSLPPATR